MKVNQIVGVGDEPFGPHKHHIFKFILTLLINWSIELLHVIVEVTET